MAVQLLALDAYGDCVFHACFGAAHDSHLPCFGNVYAHIGLRAFFPVS